MPSALITMLRRRAATLWVWQGLFVLAVIAIPVTNHFTLQTAMSQMRFAAMDSRDTFYLANLGTFETAQHVHAEIAKMAAETIFSRNPDGLDYPERMERLFNPATTAQLNKDTSRDADVCRAQAIHQKFEAGTVRELAVNDNTAFVAVEGQVLRTGMFNQRIVNDTKKVVVFLRLTTNNDIARNGRYPLVVTDYQERFE